MRNVLQILRRDLKRLVTVPAAWVIMIGITIIPPLYAWFNIYGFWNPYGNTQGIKVAVANVDKGTDNALLGKMNLGDQIEDTLKDNDQLGWEFMGKAEAMEAVQSGDCYAAIIIPSNFSEDLANVVTDSKNRPTLEYYVNEKSSPISPKITDQGATTVDRTVNNTFVSTVSEVLTKAVNSANGTINGKTNSFVNETTTELDKTQKNVNLIRSTIEDLDAQLANVPQQTQSARQAMNDVQLAAASAGKGLANTATAIGTAQNGLNTFTSNANTALENGSGLISQAASDTTTSINKVTTAVSSASGTAQQAVSNMQSVTDSNARLIEKLKNVSDNAQYQDIIKKLEDTNNTAAGTLNDLKTLSENTQSTSDSVSKLATDFNTSTQNSLKSMGDARNTLNSGALPQLNSGLSSLAMTAGTLSGTVTSQTTVVNQTSAVLDQLDQVANDTRTTLQNTDKQLEQVENKLITVSTDLKALGSVDMLKSLTGDSSLNTEKIASFMQSPTVIDTKNVYPMNSYGSGMAPLMTNLALWVGAFAFVVIFKVEVDDEGLEDLDLTTSEKYFARYMLLGIMGAIQGAITTIGNLIIGVQTVNAPLYILTGVITSLVYLSITFALSTSFMHIGKGLCVALIIVQIPGASGLYPIEMMPGFFQKLNPFLPFTYSIRAMRECIAGYYDHTYVKNLTVLWVFVALALFIGLVLRPLLMNLNHLFDRRLEETEMMVGETATSEKQLPQAQLMLKTLMQNEETKKKFIEKSGQFEQRYPKMIKMGFAGIIIIPLVFLILSFSLQAKFVFLILWILSLIALVVYLICVEYVHDRIERQLEMSGLTEKELMDMIKGGKDK